MSASARARLGRAMVAGLIVAVGGGHSAPGATSSAQVDGDAVLTPVAEAWYQPDPVCEAPVGCAPAGVLPAASPYPSGTMHVGVSAGRETARSYVAFPFDGLRGTITMATLTVELDTAPLSGDRASADADIRVCLTTEPVIPVQGSFAPPPPADCSASARATYEPTPSPHLRADLGPLVGGLDSGAGLVLLPDGEVVAPSDTWHAVFSAHDRTGADTTAPATLELVLVDEVELPEDPAPFPELDAPGSGAVDAAPGAGLVAPRLQPQATTAPRADSPPPAAETLAPATAVTEGGYPYPIVWVLPLVLLVLVPTVARALTKDLA